MLTKPRLYPVTLARKDVTQVPAGDCVEHMFDFQPVKSAEKNGLKPHLAVTVIDWDLVVTQASGQGASPTAIPLLDLYAAAMQYLEVYIEAYKDRGSIVDPGCKPFDFPAWHMACAEGHALRGPIGGDIPVGGGAHSVRVRLVIPHCDIKRGMESAIPANAFGANDYVKVKSGLSSCLDSLSTGAVLTSVGIRPTALVFYQGSYVPPVGLMRYGYTVSSELEFDVKPSSGKRIYEAAIIGVRGGGTYTLEKLTSIRSDHPEFPVNDNLNEFLERYHEAHGSVRPWPNSGANGSLTPSLHPYDETAVEGVTGALQTAALMVFPLRYLGNPTKLTETSGGPFKLTLAGPTAPRTTRVVYSTVDE